MRPHPMVVARAARVRLAAFDVDGVLTDGAILLGDHGLDVRRFCAADGLGTRLLIDSGITVVWISGRTCEAVSARAEELGVERVFQGCMDKPNALRALCTELRLELTDVAFMGDDLNDLPCMAAVGLRLAPVSAVPEIRRLADWVSSAPAGAGAVRQACELLLRSRGAWDAATERYLRHRPSPASATGPSVQPM